MADITNRDDVIDSREIIERIDELRTDLRLDEVADAKEAVEEAQAELDGAEIEDDISAAQGVLDAAQAELAEILAASEGEDHEDEREELAALEAVAKEGEDYAPDWTHGASLIRESYWVEYVEEMLKDIGDVPQDLPAYLVIDWDKTADNIKIDYTEIDFDGVAYLVR